jgi:UDP-N-acetylmuramoylalanine--D-glutamate ligase
MAGIKGNRAILDRRTGDGAARPHNVEVEMTMRIEGATVLVAGMARSGLAAAALLAKHGARVIACDTKPLEAMPQVAAQLGALGADFRIQSPESFLGVDLIVLSPGVPVTAIPDGTEAPVIGELELASHYLQGRTIGITGSNGKTTTTSMVGHILKESGIPCQVGGNIGLPPSGMVDSSRDGQWNVLELSSFQLETITEFRADIGVCLNITPDHLDRHGTLDAYAAAKRRLFETQTKNDYAVLNADDPICSGFQAHAKSRVIWFSLENPVAEPGFWLGGSTLRNEGGPLMNAGEIPVRGRHNIENTLAATTVAHLAGASHEQIRSAVSTFRAVEHRLEFVRTWNRISFFNDSKATNVDATLKAIEAFDGGLWIILGGKDKDSDYTVLREPLKRKARAALLIGAAASKIESQLKGAVPLIHSGDLKTAIETGAAKAAPGDTVLLAPACASFDQFDNYEHRGRVFKTIVNGL